MLSLYRPLHDRLRYETLQPGFSFHYTRPEVSEPQGFSPAVDVVEYEDHYEMNVDLPGVAPEDIEIDVLEQRLTLRGERRETKGETEELYRRNERGFGHFERTFSLPKGTATDAIEARVDSGVLVVQIPKPQQAKPEVRRIEVKGEGLLAKAKKAVAHAMETPLPTHE